MTLHKQISIASGLIFVGYAMMVFFDLVFGEDFAPSREFLEKNHEWPTLSEEEHLCLAATSAFWEPRSAKYQLTRWQTRKGRGGAFPVLRSTLKPLSHDLVGTIIECDLSDPLKVRIVDFSNRSSEVYRRNTALFIRAVGTKPAYASNVRGFPYIETTR